MNILYLIGNGFDLNLGMKTSYQDFYEYYKNLPSKTPAIDKLKTNIHSNYTNWSDLELGIGQYTKELKSNEELEETFDDLLTNLAEYLDSINSDFDTNNFDKQKFVQDIKNPVSYLTQADKVLLNSFMDKFDDNWRIDTITFNYTKYFDYFFGEKNNSAIDIGLTTKRRSVYLGLIYHIHGYTDSRMVLGVNDKSQILNQSFHEEIDAKETLIKSESNTASKHQIEKLCENLILHAHIICIFGSSIGDTDKIWWNLIANKIKHENCKLIIFHHHEHNYVRETYKNARVERAVKKNFLDKIKAPESEKIEMEKNIFVAINTEFFDLHQKPIPQYIAPPSI